ncbi:MAG: DUF4920 domain-containing protein [Myxococcales bacterium]|nr:DUF4920 domain-containing protein [Myxococcales bacterium]
MSGLIARSFATVLVVAPLLAGCSKGPTKSEPVTASAPTSAAASSTAVAPKGQTFGAGVTLTDAVSIDAILAEPTAYKGKTVRVEGMVTDVCPKRGCWFEMAGGQPGAKLRFKVTDGDMVFPPDAKGKLAVAQGEVSVHELTLEQTKEYAEEQAKEYGKPYDPASITKPQAIVRIDGTGAVFRDKI